MVLPEEPPEYGTADPPAGASEPTARASGLPSAHVAALRAEVGAWVRAPQPAPAGLRRLLRDLSAEARANGVTAERLLVEFKLLWYALPEVRALRGQQQSELLAELVTVCIREYYAAE